MRTLDQIYWDCCCNDSCKCKNLEDALLAHPEVKELRDGRTTNGNLQNVNVRTELGRKIRAKFSAKPVTSLTSLVSFDFEQLELKYYASLRGRSPQ